MASPRAGTRAGTARWAALARLVAPGRGRALAGALGLIAIAGCDAPRRPTPPDAGLDAATDAPDAPPPDPCPPLGPLLEVTSSSCPELEVGERFCAAQDGCALTVTGRGASGPATASITGREVALVLAGVECVLSLDDEGGAALDCDDTLGIGCRAELRGIAVADAPTCCVPGDARCATGTACTLVAPEAAGAIATTACVERTGTVAEGAACVRAVPGHDDCAAGLFCTALGAPAGARACRRLCTAETDCAAGEVCTETDAVPATGLCAARCDPFAVPDACGAGLGCTPIAVLGAGTPATTCAAEGAGTLGALCAATGCQAGLACAIDPGTVVSRCRAYCDAAHPCTTAGDSCQPLAAGASLGTCVPD